MNKPIIRVALIVVIVETNFFERKFGVALENPARNGGKLIDRNDPQLHMIAYLQVAIISQALIFVTRAHSFFFMERPSFALMFAFCVAQLVSSIIAAYGDWGFTNVAAISGGWIGIIWVWVSTSPFIQYDGCSLSHKNIIWFIPLDWIKFAMRATLIKKINERERARIAQAAIDAAAAGAPVTRQVSRVQSIHESLYSNRTSFIKRTMGRFNLGKRVHVKHDDLARIGSIQANAAGQALRRNPSRTAMAPGVIGPVKVG